MRVKKINNALFIQGKSNYVIVKNAPKQYLCVEVTKTNNDKWITVKPHGEDEKGRHLKLEGDETPKEAMKRQWGVDVDKKQKKDIEKNVKEFTVEEVEGRLSDLRAQRKVFYDKISENIRNNPEYKTLKEKEEKVKEEYFSLSFDNPLHREKSKELDEIQDEIRHTMYRLEDEERDKIKDKLSELNKKIDDLQNEKNRRHLEEVQKRIEEEKEKEAQKQAEKEKEKQRLIEVAKTTYTPQTIAGVSRGEPMDEESADGGKPNPYFSKGNGYQTNCQSCVVCYEARLRGYNVQTLPNKKGSKLAILSTNTNAAWLSQKDGWSPDFIQFENLPKNSKQCYNLLLEKMEERARYHLAFCWKGKRKGHIVTLKKENGVLKMYDPQNGGKKEGEEFKEYLKRIKYGYNKKESIELLRVDNLSFNPEFMNDIMEGAKNE